MNPALILSVVVLAKHHPQRLELSGCGQIRSLAVAKTGVEVCDRAKRCRVESQVVLTCPQGAIVSLPSSRPRRYGPTLRVSVDDGALRTITEVELESYVGGVVASEMAGAPDEARKAQAIVARTFALAAKRTPRHADADLCDLTHCQVFRSSLRDPIVETTRGRTLLDGVAPVPVFFHSTCAGHTKDAHRVWPELTTTHLIGVADLDPSGEPFCRSSPHFNWMNELEEGRLSQAIERWSGRRLDPSTLEIDRLNDGFLIRDHDDRFEVGAHRLHLELGRVLGWNAVKSPDFTVERAGRSLRLRGRGLGHGVGLCQTGAIERARRGATAEEILRAYFPLLELSE